MTDDIEYDLQEDTRRYLLLGFLSKIPKKLATSRLFFVPLTLLDIHVFKTKHFTPGVRMFKDYVIIKLWS